MMNGVVKQMLGQRRLKPIQQVETVSFISKLAQRWRTSDSMLCVGLDPDPRRIPPAFAAQADGIERFCRQIIDATAPYVCAFKPQIAYFAAQGAEDQLTRVIAYIRQTQPDLPVILDAKRSDIGATAAQYAREAFERYDADAVTVNPYMGSDSIDPFSAWGDRGIFLLCRTSNPGGDDIQQLSVQSDSGDTAPLFEHVARMAAGRWNTTGQIGLVVGATYPAELGRVRELVGDMPLLVPGIGAQGGDIQATVAAGCDSTGNGMLINSSRAILYASNGPDFAQAAADAAQKTQRAINAARGR